VVHGHGLDRVFRQKPPTVRSQAGEQEPREGREIVGRGDEAGIARWEGGIFVGYYVAYVTYLILASKEHDAIPVFSAVMMSFVVPITVVTLVVVLIRKPQVT